MEADPGGTAALAVTQKEWMNVTVTALDHTKNRAKEVQAAVAALEQQEAVRLAAQRAKARLQELQAEAAEKKRKEAEKADRERRAKEMQAEELRRQQEALVQAKQTERAELRAAAANVKRKQRAEKAASEKDKVMKALKLTSQQVLAGILECQHLCGKLWGSLMMCEKRQRLREGRPQTETFKDNADAALEKEMRILTTSREQLNDLVSTGESLRSELETLGMQLNTEQSRENCMLRIMKSNSTPTLGSANQRSLKDVLKRAHEAIDEGVELARQMAATRLKVESDSESALVDVHTGLDRRKAELGQLIKGLQDESKASEKTIGDAEKRIVRLRRRVQSTMESPRSSKATEEQLFSAESLLLDLRSLKHSLEADLSNKFQALKIDESCRQLTKIKSGGHVSKLGLTMRKTKSDGAFRVRGSKEGATMQPAG
eukprot:TRINITY_DN51538_c0_g1_i1.p1 TRINITY_DN51538_c0_g1~~TRINITY_DN51538_c0_g1_i1.p1  ORF type:complete len:431 (-),score=119.45 TRINITY_DN51538_c0_g1_i1:55-1347(-)